MEHRKTGPVAVVSIAAVTVVAAAIQSYHSNNIALKITWTFSTPTNPTMTCQIASQCRM